MFNIRLLSVSKNTDHLICSTEYSQNNDFRKTVDLRFVNTEIKVHTDPIFVSNNKTGLPKVYNDFLEDSRSKKLDAVILCHSDVVFDYRSIIAHYLSVCGKYDIVGFAGTKKIDLKISPLTWFTGSKNFPSERFGKVFHTQFNLGESFFNIHSPSVSDTEVCTIDGLCMILGKKVLENPKIRFDEQFLFDFYDLDFCLSAVINHKLKIGVIVDRIIHKSVGTSVLQPKFLDQEKKFREKWCKPRAT